MARQQWIDGAYRRLFAATRPSCGFASRPTVLDPKYAAGLGADGLGPVELRFWHGQDVHALPAAERALEINPNLPEAHCIKARYLEEEGGGRSRAGDSDGPQARSRIPGK